MCNVTTSCLDVEKKLDPPHHHPRMQGIRPRTLKHTHPPSKTIPHSPFLAATGTRQARSVEERARPLRVEGRAHSLGRRARDAVRQWEGDLRVDELLDARPLDGLGHLIAVQLRVIPLERTLACLHDARVDDLNRREACAVATGELGVHLVNGAAQRDSTELLVHVVSARPRVVLERQAVVLDRRRVSLADLRHGEDVSRARLHLVQLVQEVPARE